MHVPVENRAALYYEVFYFTAWSVFSTDTDRGRFFASFKTGKEYTSTSPMTPPENWFNFQNYTRAFVEGNIADWVYEYYVYFDCLHCWGHTAWVHDCFCPSSI